MESKRKAALYVNQQALDRLALALFAAVWHADAGAGLSDGDGRNGGT